MSGPTKKAPARKAPAKKKAPAKRKPAAKKPPAPVVRDEDGVYDLAAMLERDRLKNSTPFRLPSGRVVHLPSPELWPDVGPDATDDDVGAALFGADEWAAMRAEGVPAKYVVPMIHEALGASLGESAASSTS